MNLGYYTQSTPLHTGSRGLSPGVNLKQKSKIMKSINLAEVAQQKATTTRKSFIVPSKFGELDGKTFDQVVEDGMVNEDFKILKFTAPDKKAWVTYAVVLKDYLVRMTPNSGKGLANAISQCSNESEVREALQCIDFKEIDGLEGNPPCMRAIFRSTLSKGIDILDEVAKDSKVKDKTVEETPEFEAAEK